MALHCCYAGEKKFDYSKIKGPPADFIRGGSVITSVINIAYILP